MNRESHWSFVTGHWSLVIGHWSLVILPSVGARHHQDSALNPDINTAVPPRIKPGRLMMIPNQIMANRSFMIIWVTNPNMGGTALSRFVLKPRDG
uniref:Uncharacterized protein n=1 Tax=Planktothricoides sp. SpSt-374 TaxID=2282167 RepID=A0A7C3ZM40_9CYAN